MIGNKIPRFQKSKELGTFHSTKKAKSDSFPFFLFRKNKKSAACALLPDQRENSGLCRQSDVGLPSAFRRASTGPRTADGCTEGKPPAHCAFNAMLRASKRLDDAVHLLRCLAGPTPRRRPICANGHSRGRRQLDEGSPSSFWAPLEVGEELPYF